MSFSWGRWEITGLCGTHISLVEQKIDHNCKARGKHVSNFPMGGQLEVSAARTPCIVDRSIGVQARVEASTSATLPTGRWGLLRSLRHAQPVVYRSVIRRRASENQSKRVSSFPIGAMGNYRSLRHVHKAIVDQSVGRS